MEEDFIEKQRESNRDITGNRESTQIISVS